MRIATNAQVATVRTGAVFALVGLSVAVLGCGDGSTEEPPNMMVDAPGVGGALTGTAGTSATAGNHAGTVDVAAGGSGGGGGSGAGVGGTSVVAGGNGGSSTAGHAGSGGAAQGGKADAGGSAGGVIVDAGKAGTWVDISPFGQTDALGLGVSVSSPGTLYANVKKGFPPNDPASGIFKSTDGGASWGSGHVGTVFKNYDGSTYNGKNPWLEGVSWTIAVDPTDANVVYAHCSFFGPQGPWKSIDGGNSWRQIFSSTNSNEMSADVYAIAIDPLDHLHVLITFHSGWAFTGNAGVAESTNGGMSWIKRGPQGNWGAGHYAFFLGRDDGGKPSPSYWIVATQGAGFWRTADDGVTFTQVSSAYNMQHGAGGLYRASPGTLYMGAVSHLLRSTDNGRTWSDSGAPSNSDGYNAVIGDGTRLYAQSANTGTNTTGPQTYFTSLETDGTHWVPYNSQRFADGPGWMGYDAVNKIVYASHWDHGLWRLAVGE